MKKTALAIGALAFFLLVSLAYAGVLNYYGKVEVTADVKGPTFYADNTSALPNSVYYRLKINEIGSGSVDLQDGNRVLFITDSLGISSWYPATWKVYVQIYSSAEGGGLSAIRIKKVSQDLITETPICEWDGITLATGNNSINRTCSLTEEITFNPTDRLGLEIVGAGAPSYTIYTDGSTRIEVFSPYELGPHHPGELK